MWCVNTDLCGANKSSVWPIVTDQVAWSVDLSICHSIETCKNGWDAIEMLFGLRTRVSQSNHVLDGGLDHPTRRGNFLGKGAPTVKYRDCLLWAVQKRLRCCLGHWVWLDTRNHMLDAEGGPDPPWEGPILTVKGHVPTCPTTLRRELCKNGWTDRDTVWGVDLGGPKDACVTGGAHSRDLMSNYCDHLFTFPVRPLACMSMALASLWYAIHFSFHLLQKGRIHHRNLFKVYFSESKAAM